MRAIYLKARIHLLTVIQKCFGSFGLQIRRLKAGVEHENADLELLRLAGKDVANIIEFGAADGRDAEDFALRFPRARVLAIEPVPASFKKLEDRKSRAPNLITIEAAVSNRSGTTTLFIASEADASSISAPVNTGSAFDKHSEAVDQVEVKQVTVDELCRTHNFQTFDIFKMDAQGAEVMALEGATELLNRNGVRIIYSEVQFIRLYEKACLFHELWLKLAQHGFYLHNIYNLNHNEHGQLCWGDAIFVHESARPQNATRPFPGLA